MTRRSVCFSPLALYLVFCGKETVLSSLRAVVTAADAVLPFLPGLTPETLAKIRDYLTAVLAGVEQSTAILATTDSAAAKAAQIAAIFARIVAPVLPAGTAQNVVAIVQAVADAVVKFLGAVAAAPSGRQAATVFAKDKDALQEIAKRAREVKARVR